MASVAVQTTMFEERIPVDKNFSFSTLIIAGQPTFKIDLEKTFEERPEHIMDVFNFIVKRYYDNPIVNKPFTLQEYCGFLGKSISKFRHENMVEPDKHKRWSNYLERLLYKMLERNIVRKGTFEIPSRTSKKKIEIHEKLSLLNSYQKVSYENLKDKRMVEYEADLSDPIKENISTFLFYTSMSDYRTLVNTFYRNPNYRFLYFRLANILNNLRAGIDDPVSFDELVHILGYEAKSPRHLKESIETNVKKILTLESLKGLHFDFKENRNGNMYVPNFELSYKHEDNTLRESRKDKYKRLDLLVITKLRRYLPNIKGGRFSYLDLRLSLQGIPEFVEIFEECYKSVMKKSPSTEGIGKFLDHLVYIDDYNNAYASNLVRHTQINGELLMNDTQYQKSHVTIL